MKNFEYTVQSNKAFNETVSAVEQNTAAKGFRVLHVHDIAATLAEKGLHREPLKIVEVCNAKFAHEVLAKDVTIALMLPCPITVYEKDGKAQVSTMLPSAMSEMFALSGIEAVVEQVERALVSIVDEAAK